MSYFDQISMRRVQQLARLVRDEYPVIAEDAENGVRVDIWKKDTGRWYSFDVIVRDGGEDTEQYTEYMRSADLAVAGGLAAGCALGLNPYTSYLLEVQLDGTARQTGPLLLPRR